MKTTDQYRHVSHGRRLAGLGGLVLALVLAVLLSLMLGAKTVPAQEVIGSLLGSGAASEQVNDIVASRQARTVGAVLVGAALALAGAGLQGLTRNPLGDAGILGINSGAALAVVVGISALGVQGIGQTTIAAFLGAGLAMLLVYVVASVGSQGPTPLKLALAGAIMAAALTSVTLAILMVSEAALDEFRFWQVGTVASRSSTDFLAGAGFIAAGALLMLATARAANAVALGDEMARSLGFRLGWVRVFGGVAVVLLAGTATALTGPIGFVGLMVPHAMRLLFGADYRWLMPASMLAGPVLVLLADTIGRLVAPPSEVQVGVMCALLGAPMLIVLLRRGFTQGAL